MCWGLRLSYLLVTNQQKHQHLPKSVMNARTKPNNNPTTQKSIKPLLKLVYRYHLKSTTTAELKILGGTLIKSLNLIIQHVISMHSAQWRISKGTTVLWTLSESNSYFNLILPKDIIIIDFITMYHTIKCPLLQKQQHLPKSAMNARTKPTIT